MKTREQVDELKRQWLSDGCWDIEVTEGFENYRDELLKFRLETEQKFKDIEAKRITDKCLRLDITPQLLEYIEGMERTLERLSKRIERLEEPDESSNSMQEYYLRKARGVK